MISALVGRKGIKLAFFLPVFNLSGELAGQIFKRFRAAAAIAVCVEDNADVGADAAVDYKVRKVLKRIE